MRIHCVWTPVNGSDQGLGVALQALGRAPGVVVEVVSFDALEARIVVLHEDPIGEGDLAAMVVDPIMAAVQTQVEWKAEDWTLRGLTARQAQVLDVIRDSIARHGYPPTLRELGEAFGIRSTNGVNDHLRALERKGHIWRDGMKSRGIRIVARANGPEVKAAPGPREFTDPRLVRIAGEVHRLVWLGDPGTRYCVDSVQPAQGRMLIGAEGGKLSGHKEDHELRKTLERDGFGRGRELTTLGRLVRADLLARLEGMAGSLGA